MHASAARRRLDGRAGLLVVPAAAFAVHQLRYDLAYGARAGTALAAQGHSYLHSIVPWIVLSLAAAASSYLRRLARAAAGDPGRAVRRPAAPALWALTTAALVAIYAVQETLEGLFAAGHPTGSAAVFGHGGWWAVPVAAAVSALLVALFRVGDAVVRLVTRIPGLQRRWRPILLPRPHAVLVPAPAPLARSAAGRAPPAR